MHPSQSRHEPPVAAEARSPSLGSSLAVDAERSPGIRLQPLARDLAAAAEADPVRPVVDSPQRGVDLRQHLLRVVAERVVDLAAEGCARGLGEVIVARRGDLLDLLVERSGMLVAEGRERVLDPLLLLEQRVAEVLGVDARQRLSFLPRSPAAEARRRSISAGPIPVSSTIFSLPPCPETSFRAVRGSASVSARRRRTASLARPRSGASVTRTFQASPCRPTNAVRPDPGLTRKRSRVVSAVTRSVYVGLPLGSVRVGHAVPAAFLALVRAFVDGYLRLRRSGRLGCAERRERLLQLQP